ncbi:hypothetical protein DFJ73DRAFT_546934 [Zopfochytrium polystomum]|nr:hypothetical protein DFJ73DRAFT_546934 [Zopfochytrium polystomum]
MLESVLSAQDFSPIPRHERNGSDPSTFCSSSRNIYREACVGNPSSELLHAQCPPFSDSPCPIASSDDASTELPAEVREEQVFFRDFVCCSTELGDLLDLIKHIEEEHCTGRSDAARSSLPERDAATGDPATNDRWARGEWVEVSNEDAAAAVAAAAAAAAADVSTSAPLATVAAFTHQDAGAAVATKAGSKGTTLVALESLTPPPPPPPPSSLSSSATTLSSSSPSSLSLSSLQQQPPVATASSFLNSIIEAATESSRDGKERPSCPSRTAAGAAVLASSHPASPHTKPDSQPPDADDGVLTVAVCVVVRQVRPHRPRHGQC